MAKKYGDVSQQEYIRFKKLHKEFSKEICEEYKDCKKCPMYFVNTEKKDDCAMKNVNAALQEIEQELFK